MTNGLFRQEAIEHQRHRLHGDVLLLPRFPHTLISCVLFVWMVLVIVWLATSSYARKETVFGWLEPPTGVVRIYPEELGIIKSILVTEGEEVVKDQPLIIVNGDRILASGDHLESKLLEEYEAQRKLLDEQLIRTQSIHVMHSQDIEQRIAAAKNELAMLNQQIETFNQRAEIIEEQAQRLDKLRKAGHISSTEYDNAFVQVLTLRSDRQALSRNRIAQQNLIEQLNTERNLLPDENANQIDQLRERLSNIAQQIAQLSGERSHVIKAPRDGVINNLQVIEGQQAQPGNNVPLLTLIPADMQLTAHLLIPVRSAGFIEPKQRLDIRYDAFPYQKFGLYSGEIHSVSKTLLLPNELLNVPVPVEEPVYRVTAKLTRADVQAYGKNFPLKPGMTLTADIRLSERSLFHWLLEPILSLQGRL